MSGTNTNPDGDARARIDAEAIAWVERSDREDWSVADKAKLDEWRSQSTAHMIAWLRARDAWQRANRLAALRGTFGQPRNAAATRSGASRLRMVAGVAIAAFLVALWFVLPGTQSASQTYSTVIGGHKTLALNDGTRIELNTNTQLRTRFDEHHRTVWIDRGEAYFEVAHNAAKPFVVMAGGHRITDLGTKFLVKQQPGQIQVSLIEGRAEIDTPATPRQARTVLEPGDVAVATANAVSVVKRTEQIVTRELSWRRGVLIFDHTTLAEAAAQLNRYNTEKIIVSGEEARAELIEGTFPANNVELFGRVAQSVLGLQVKKRNDGIVISH